MRNKTALVLLLAMTAPAGAASVTVQDAWIRALPAGLPAGGYFTLRNTGTAEIVLTGAASPACGMLMLHKSDDKGGMAGMDDVTAVTVPAGGTLRFAPGGYHLMCMQAGPAIKPGNSVPVTLTFRDGTAAQARFAVRNAAGK